MLGQFKKMNIASSLGSGTLPGNTITNPKEDLKGITTRRGTAYLGPTITTTSSSLVVERETEVTKDMIHPTNNGSTEDVQTPAILIESQILNSEQVISQIIEHVASPDKLCELAKTPLNEHCSVVLLKKLQEKLGDPGCNPDLAEKEPPRSIFTWDDLVSKFINQFFPPYKTTNLRNEIANFQHRFDESLCEACDRFKDLLRSCPHRGFSELHPLDTFYNALNLKDQDSLNSVAGGNFLDKMPRECLAIIESKSKVCYLRNKPVVAKVSTNTSTFGISPDVAKLKDMVKALLLDKKSQNQAPATVKAVEESSYQAPAYQAPAPQTQGVSKDDFSAYVKANDAVMRNMQTQGQNMQNQWTNMTDLLTKFVNSNNASTSSSGTLPSNTIANLRSDLKAITTRSGVSYDGPQVPPPLSFLPKVVQSKSLILTSEPVNSPIIEPVTSPVSAPRPNLRPSIPYPSRMRDQNLRDKANDQREKSFQIFKDLNFNISFADALILMPKFVPSFKSLLINKDKLCELSRTPLNEHCSTVLLKKLPEKLGDPGKFLIPCDFPKKTQCLALTDLGASINLMPLSVWNKLFLPDLNPTCMTLELADRSISHPVGVPEDVYVKVGSFHFPADFAVVDFDADPRVPLILGRSFLKTGRALIDVFEGELTLRVGKEAITFNLDQTLRLLVNYNDMTAKRIDIINMACEEYSQEVLGFYDVMSSGNPTPYYDPIVFTTSSTLTPFGNSNFLLEEVDAFLALDDDPTSPKVDQSYLDPERDILLLEAFLNDDPSLPLQLKEIICLNPWVSPVHCVPKKGGFTVVENEENELILTHLVTGWRVCIDYRKLNEATARTIFLYHQEKTTFTCPYRTFAYRRMPLGLCNAPGTFQRKLTEAPILIAPNWDMPFELMCDASDFAIGAVLGQRQDKHFRPIHYVGKTMTERESNYTTTKKEMLAVVYAFEKFRSYLIMNKSIVYTDHSALKYLFAKKHSKARLLCWVLLLQEFTFKVIDTKGAENLAADHLSRLENPHQNVLDPKEINESFPLETLNLVSTHGKSSTSWFADFTNYHAGNFVIKGMSSHQKSKFFKDARKPLTFSRLATMDPPGDTMAQITQPRSDRGTHFYNDQFAKVMQKFGVTRRLATPYHPQTSGHVKVSNRGLKCILKRTVRENRVSWSDKLDDALWAFQTAYKTPIGCTPYKLVYGKACHLPIDLEHKAYWALKHANFDMKTVGDHRRVQLNELRDQAYENSLIYKEKTKRLHDSKIKDRIFNIDDRVLLFNSRLKIFSCKLKSRWSGPFSISHVYPYGTIELVQPDGPNFKVNGHLLKHYFREDVSKLVVSDLQTFPMDY
nr:reverse transcriptase domain-containing protein [Tanacetum cinerariifolium]